MSISTSAVAVDNTQSHLVVRLKKQRIAIPANVVRQITKMPEVVAVPGTTPEIRGVINVRGSVIKLIDLRLRLGMPCYLQEIDDLVKLLHDREEDHKKWLTELEISARENRPFTLTRDPHQCKFGKWYDTYKPDNNGLAFLWRGFDLPHKRIHAIADVVCAHVAKGESDHAQALIERTRTGELATMVELFAEVTRSVHETNRELAIVLRHEKAITAISVDAVDSVEPIADETTVRISELLPEFNCDLISRAARQGRTDEITLLLDAEKLFQLSARVH